MLINNVSTERRASLIVKNSAFYIEIAKFVQAYTTIVKNPNEFLPEIGEQPIDKKKQHLNWEQLVKIMQTCDLGFSQVPSRMDLAIYYNYALEIGSVDSLKKIASVDEVAEAQKHYYNFVDEAKTNAEESYEKQKKIVEARQREMDYIDGKLARIKAKNCFSMIMMCFSILLGMVGVVSFFVDNIVATTIGKLLPIWQPKFIGGIVLVALMLLLFFVFNKLFVNSKRDHLKLKIASKTIFLRGDEMIAKQETLKKKLDELNRDYLVVQNELKDKNKKFDVKHNIEILKSTNKYYQKLCEFEEEYSSALKNDDMKEISDEDFAPVKLSKEQEENMQTTKKATIGLTGQLDTNAYNEKFEKSRKTKEKEEKENSGELSQEEKEQEEKKKETEQVLDSIEKAKELLGKTAEKEEIQK